MKKSPKGQNPISMFPDCEQLGRSTPPSVITDENLRNCRREPGPSLTTSPRHQALLREFVGKWKCGFFWVLILVLRFSLLRLLQCCLFCWFYDHCWGIVILWLFYEFFGGFEGIWGLCSVVWLFEGRWC